MLKGVAGTDSIILFLVVLLLPIIAHLGDRRDGIENRRSHEQGQIEDPNLLAIVHASSADGGVDQRVTSLIREHLRIEYLQRALQDVALDQAAAIDVQ